MKHSWWMAALLFRLSLGYAVAADDKLPVRVPVLLELFTSEGCSSCPPADRLLESWDREQPFAHADVIAISEHVDYWNHGGWADPYSSAFFSNRQRGYGDRLQLDSVYTPQLVVDGTAELVGSDRKRAAEAIGKASQASKAQLAITVKSSQGKGAEVLVSAPEGVDRGGDLYLVVASDRAVSQVSGGENSGRQLSHVAVARSFDKLQPWDGAVPLHREAHIRIPAGAKPGETRVIAFVQDARSGKVLRVAQARL